MAVRSLNPVKCTKKLQYDVNLKYSYPKLEALSNVWLQLEDFNWWFISVSGRFEFINGVSKVAGDGNGVYSEKPKNLKLATTLDGRNMAERGFLKSHWS